MILTFPLQFHIKQFPFIKHNYGLRHKLDDNISGSTTLAWHRPVTNTTALPSGIQRCAMSHTHEGCDRYTHHSLNLKPHASQFVMVLPTALFLKNANLAVRCMQKYALRAHDILLVVCDGLAEARTEWLHQTLAQDAIHDLCETVCNSHFEARSAVDIEWFN
jgi:hypothetical protein